MYGFFDLGFMHFSLRIPATSRTLFSSSTCLSFSLTWSWPSCNILMHIFSSSSVPNTWIMSSRFAKMPLDTLLNTVVDWSTSSRSVSSPFRQFFTVFLYAAISNRLPNFL